MRASRNGPTSSVERAHHLGEHDTIEARVDLVRTLQQCRSVEALREHLHVGEVAGFGAAEQRDELSVGELLGVERWPDDRDDGRSAGSGVDGELDDQFLGSRDVEPHEGGAVVEAFGSPTTICDGLLELISCCGDIDVVGCAEEIEIVRRSIGEP
jgi:hypothetical protein